MADGHKVDLSAAGVNLRQALPDDRDISYFSSGLASAGQSVVDEHPAEVGDVGDSLWSGGVVLQRVGKVGHDCLAEGADDDVADCGALTRTLAADDDTGGV